MINLGGVISYHIFVTVIKSMEMFITSKYSVIAEKYFTVSYKSETLMPPIYMK